MAIVSLATAHGQQAPRPAGKTSHYANAKWRWSISYPAGWTLDGKDPDLVRIHAFSENALCTIHSGPVDRFNTVDEFTDFMLAHDTEFLTGKGQKFVVLKRQRIKLPKGIIGNDVLAEIGPGGHSRRIHVLADGRGFAIDCEGYTKHWDRIEPAYQRVISSFTVVK